MNRKVTLLQCSGNHEDFVRLIKIDAYSWRKSLNSKKCCFRLDGLAAIRNDTKFSVA